LRKLSQFERPGPCKETLRLIRKFFAERNSTATVSILLIVWSVLFFKSIWIITVVVKINTIACLS